MTNSPIALEGRPLLTDPGFAPHPDSPAPAARSSNALGGPRPEPSALSPEAEPFYKPVPGWVGFTLRPEALAPASRGYATRATGTASPSSSTAKSSTAKKTTTSGELAFLYDKTLSIEEKLFRFMSLLLEKGDQELIGKMEEYEAKKSASTSGSASGSASKKEAAGPAPGAVSQANSGGGGGGGLFGALGDALGGIGSMLTGAATSLAKDLGGPVLAAACTAVGLPFLAPIALQIGGDLGALAVETAASAIGVPRQASTAGVGSVDAGAKSAMSAKTTGAKTTGAKATSAKTTSSSSSSTAAEFDEKLEMFKLQRLVEKQNTMFSALSNVLKSMHEAQLTAVGNIR